MVCIRDEDVREKIMTKYHFTYVIIPLLFCVVLYSSNAEAVNAFGGHLAQGTIIFACEIIIHAFEGPELTISYDDITGLPLWREE